jgi:hypothetical protein
MLPMVYLFHPFDFQMLILPEKEQCIAYFLADFCPVKDKIKIELFKKTD